MRAIRITVVAVALLAGTATAHAQCVGDCDGSNTVTVNELVRGVNIALDQADVSVCPSFDADSSNSVTVNELVLGVNNLLRDLCANLGTPTPTASPTPSLPPPTLTFQSCPFGGAETDTLVINLAGAAFPPLPVVGEIGVACETVGGGAGAPVTRRCGCQFRSLEPVDLIGIGQVCIEEGKDDQGNTAACPIGEQICGGSSESVKIDLIADAQIGSCSGNADCRTKCDAHCAAMNPPRIRFNSGCESHCQGGNRADQMCECDTIGSTTCAPGSTLGCPLGSCEGKDNELDIDCHCQCVNEAAGDPSPDGGFRCRLPTAIRVESNLPCDNTDVLVRLPPLCAPFTSDQNIGTLVNANEDALSEIAPDPLQGTTIQCNAFDTSPVGMKLVTNLAFFDSTVGDLMSQLSLTCKAP